MKSPASARPPILLIEDTISLQMVYRSILTGAGYRVAVAGTAAEGLSQFMALQPAIVLVDLVLPDSDGLQLMQKMLEVQPTTSIIAITANGSVNRAVDAMRAGAHDFLVKPFDEGRLLSTVQNTLAERRARSTAAIVSPANSAASLPGNPEAPAPTEVAGFIGSSDQMARIHATIGSVARSMATVFITGESGTGKELCALAVHAGSARHRKPQRLTDRY